MLSNAASLNPCATIIITFSAIYKNMNPNRLSLFLILSLLMAPVVSAFDHCIGMDMSKRLMNTELSSTDNHIPAQDSQQSSELGCHYATSCGSHFCSLFSIPSSHHSLYATSTSLFNDFIVTASTTPNYPSLFRPPISIAL